MNIFEFVLGENIKHLTFDKDGNAKFPEAIQDNHQYIGDWMEYDEVIDDGFYRLKKEEYERLCSINIIIPEGFEYDCGLIKYPYYRMRGKPVTEEQAFDIIRRTDVFFYCYTRHKDTMNTLHFNNHHVLSTYYGWCHVDGVIGENSTTYKYPTMGEFFEDWIELLLEFPYLDLMIAVTDWYGRPDDCFYSSKNKNVRDFEAAEYDEDFYNHIQVGILVRDSTIQILKPDEAVVKYKEYDSLYGKDRDRFRLHYYYDNNIYQVSADYLKRCIEANGFSVEETLKKLQRYELEKIKKNTGIVYQSEEG